MSRCECSSGQGFFSQGSLKQVLLFFNVRSCEKQVHTSPTLKSDASPRSPRIPTHPQALPHEDENLTAADLDVDAVKAEAAAQAELEKDCAGCRWVQDG